MINDGCDLKSSECIICYEQYTEDESKEPVVLHCGHTFCRSCIRMMAVDRISFNVYPCPECREETRIEKSHNGGIPPKNFLVLDMLGQYNAFISYKERSKTDVPWSYPSLSSSSTSVFSVPKTSGSSSSRLSFVPRKVSVVDLNTDTIIHSRFMIRPNEVSKLCHDWIESLWFAPADLKTSPKVPVRMNKAYVPCWMFFVDIMVTVRLAPSAVGPDGVRVTNIPFNDRIFFKCACGDEKDRKRLSKEFDASWTFSNISIHSVAVTNPRDDPESAKETKEAMETFDMVGAIAAKSSSVKGSASFELLPADALIPPYVNVEEVWNMFEPELIALHKRKAVAMLERKGLDGNAIDEISVEPPKYKSVLIYMPIYSSYYTYNGGKFRISINGQTGKVCGDRPYAPLVTTIKGFLGF